MARKTLVQVTKPALDSKGKVVIGEDKEVMYETRDYYLLHWGTQAEFAKDKENEVTHVWQYTVAICQDRKTGLVHTFEPTELRIVGTDYTDVLQQGKQDG